MRNASSAPKSGPQSLEVGRQGGEYLVGAIQLDHLEHISYGLWNTHYDYRLSSRRASGARYTGLKANDLSFRYYLNHLRVVERRACHEIGKRILQLLASWLLYLRPGLTRRWDRQWDRCYSQITGVYTFPDYLEGRGFADFAPDQTGTRWD